MTEDKEEQENELLALTSIYDESVISVSEDSEETGGQFLACLHLPENFRVAVIQDTKQQDGKLNCCSAWAIGMREKGIERKR